MLIRTYQTGSGWEREHKRWISEGTAPAWPMINWLTRIAWQVPIPCLTEAKSMSSSKSRQTNRRDCNHQIDSSYVELLSSTGKLVAVLAWNVINRFGSTWIDVPRFGPLLRHISWTFRVSQMPPHKPWSRTSSATTCCCTRQREVSNGYGLDVMNSITLSSFSFERCSIQILKRGKSDA